MTGTRKIVVRFLLFTLTMAACLGVAELFLRLQNRSMKNYDIEMWRYAHLLKIRSPNPVLGHDHVRSASAVLQSVEIRTNEFGLRGGPVSPPEKDERRILFLGSSVTLGWGVPEAETTTGVLQKMFASDHRKVTVLNAGIGNYNAVRYVERFLTELTDLKPTDIVVHAFVRDAEVLEAPSGNWFVRNSQLALMLTAAIQKRAAGTGIKSVEEHYLRLYQADAPGFIALKNALNKLSEYATANHIRLHLAMVPDIHNLQNYKLHFVHDTMRNVALEYGYRYLDLYPAFAGIKAEDVWAMPGDPHPNSLGHKKMAELLYPFLTGDTVAAVGGKPAS